jgi:hypothetical protein
MLRQLGFESITEGSAVKHANMKVQPSRKVKIASSSSSGDGSCDDDSRDDASQVDTQRGLHYPALVGYPPHYTFYLAGCLVGECGYLHGIAGSLLRPMKKGSKRATILTSKNHDMTLITHRLSH